MENEVTKENSFKEMFESTFTNYSKGKILKGKVVAINSLGIVLNIGGKKDGFIENNQISAEELASVKVGDEISAVVLDSVSGENGCISMSKIKADYTIKSDGVIANRAMKLRF